MPGDPSAQSAESRWPRGGAVSVPVAAVWHAALGSAGAAAGCKGWVRRGSSDVQRLRGEAGVPALVS